MRLTFVFFLCWAAPGQAAVYAFESENFNEVYGQYSTNDHITAVIVTNNNVPANQGLVNVADNVLSYTISDGVQTLDETNSVVLNFNLGVNGSNQVTAAWWKASMFILMIHLHKSLASRTASASTMAGRVEPVILRLLDKPMPVTTFSMI